MYVRALHLTHVKHKKREEREKSKLGMERVRGEREKPFSLERSKK